MSCCSTSTCPTCVTEQTVKFHLNNLYRKLGVPNRTAAARFAYANGLTGEG